MEEDIKRKIMEGYFVHFPTHAGKTKLVEELKKETLKNKEGR